MLAAYQTGGLATSAEAYTSKRNPPTAAIALRLHFWRDWI
jgi:hypothetical protein